MLRKGVVHSSPSLEELELRVEGAAAGGRPLRVIYGETFDGTNTVDSLRYYFTIRSFSSILSQSYGLSVRPTLLIADSNEALNRSNEVEKVRAQANARKEFAEAVKERFNCSYDVVLQSKFLENSSKMLAGYEIDPELVPAMMRKTAISRLTTADVRSTVPINRLAEAGKDDFSYTRMELETILGFDIKIGPPREKLYDDVAILLSGRSGVPPILPIYLPPTYPLGLRFGDYMSSVELLRHGLTPYRSSEIFSQNRIVLGVTPPERARELIEKTDVSKSEGKPNPLLSLAVISELARNHLESRPQRTSDLYDRFYDQKSDAKIGVTELRTLAYASLKENVLDVLLR